MEINESARKHEVSDEGILHAVEHPLVEYDIGDDDSPRRWLVLGPDQAGLMLEVVVLMFDDGAELVIHAMPMRGNIRNYWREVSNEC